LTVYLAGHHSKPEKFMKNPLIRNRLTHRKPLKLGTNKHPSQWSDLRQLSHELVNYLTVINLSCDKIRNAAVIKNQPGILSQLDLVEKTVSEAADLLATLAKDHASPADSRSEPTFGGKVYPLFQSKPSS